LGYGVINDFIVSGSSLWPCDGRNEFGFSVRGKVGGYFVGTEGFCIMSIRVFNPSIPTINTKLSMRRSKYPIGRFHIATIFTFNFLTGFTVFSIS
jgi:hypothetical protein